MHERAFPDVFSKVAHCKGWLKQQESVCGKMRWSSDSLAASCEARLAGCRSAGRRRR